MLPRTGCPKLPTEVCERIIDYASLKTVRTCSYVCRSWVPRSRRRLFYNVTLNSSRTASNFKSVLCGSPHFSLGHYVHILSIDYSPGASDRDSDGSIHAVLRVLPTLLVNLHTLGFYSIDSDVLNPLFFSLASRFTTVKSLQLKWLDNCSFREIVRMMNKFENLEELEIIAGYIDYDDLDPTTIDSSRSHKLKYLKFDHYSEGIFSDWLVASNSYQSLSTLDVPFLFGDELDDLLQKSSQTVQTLRLRVLRGNLQSQFFRNV